MNESHARLCDRVALSMRLHARLCDRAVLEVRLRLPSRNVELPTAGLRHTHDTAWLWLNSYCQIGCRRFRLIGAVEEQLNTQQRSRRAAAVAGINSDTRARDVPTSLRISSAEVDITISRSRNKSTAAVAVAATLASGLRYEAAADEETNG